MKNLFLCLLACGLLYACNSTPTATSTAEEMTTTSADRNSEPTVGNDLNATLNATVDAVEANGGNITAIPGATAVSNIDTWLAQLDGVEGAGKITGNLEVLKETLSSGNINGPLAGMVMLTLAEDTKQVVGANGNAATSALVSSLRSGGEKLTMEATSGSDLLSQTLAAVKGKAGDITTLPGSAAVSNIDSWIGKLKSMDGTSGIVNELNMLKGELSQPSINGDKVATHLKSLGETTESLAGDNMALQVLAYALDAGYWRLKSK